MVTTANYRILIIGAGGFGREILGWIKSYPSFVQLPEDGWYIGGFLDDNLNALDKYDVDIEIIGKPLEFDYQATDRVICTIAEPKPKLKLAREILKRGVKFVNLISDPKILKRGNIFGVGVIMVVGSNMTTNVTIGNFVTFNGYATVGHDAIIGDGCTINSHVDVTGHVILNDGVFVGSHATIIPSITVGEYARIGAGSVVVRNVPAYTTVMGVPAKRLFVNTPEALSDNM